MQVVKSNQTRAGPQDLRFFGNPHLWPQHPFLPVIRRKETHGEPQCGLLYDAKGVLGKCGYSATVFLVNLFDLPSNQAELLAKPKCVYDTPEELAADGWVVD